MSAKKYITIGDVNNDRPVNSIIKATEFVYKLNKKGKNTRYVRCICECGEQRLMSVWMLTRVSVSCSCVKNERFRKMATKYYPVIPKLFKSYYSMITRCYNTKSKLYERYGAKGVCVCKEWIDNYPLFMEWALSNGYKDGLSLDKDIKGDGKLYSPNTCCWVTNLENQSYKSNSVKYSYNGQLLTLGQIGRMVGVSRVELYRRMVYKNTTIENAIFLIKNKINRRYEK